MPSHPLVPVILSGGAGTRLWPLSREMAPKAFMPLPDGQTLLGKTVVRACGLPGVADLVTVTNRDLYFHTRDLYAELSGMPARHEEIARALPGIVVVEDAACGIGSEVAGRRPDHECTPGASWPDRCTYSTYDPG